MSKYGIAGRELMKGNIGNAIMAVATKSVQSELPREINIQSGRYRNGNYFFGVNGADKAFIWGNYNSSLVAYQKCPIVSAVINRKAQAMVNGKRFIMTGEGKEAKVATTPQAKGLVKLLKRPNRIQTGSQFEAQGNVYKQIYGYCPILVIKPVGYEKDFGAWSMWNIPPWMIQVEDNTDWFFKSDMKPFKSILLTYMGRSTYLNVDSVFFLKENQISTGTFMSNSNTENVSLSLPDSKLLYLEKPIDTFCASLGARGSLIRDKGPMWILTNDSGDGDAGLFPVDPEEKQDIQKDFGQYGILHGQRKAIITDAKLKLQTVGFDVAQLGLLPGEIQDAKMICDGLNYPPYLLGLVDSKFDNQAIAERTFYTNSIIPDSESEDEQWNEYLGLDALGLRIETDFSHLSVLQEDDVKRSTARLLLDQAMKIEYEAGIITMNQWLVKLGEDPIGPVGDVRATDVKNTNAPLASIIGVGGVQSLIGILTAAGLSEEARANTLTILFGVSPENAAAMVINNPAQQTTTTDATAN